jgi:hypothetical protein
MYVVPFLKQGEVSDPFLFLADAALLIPSTLQVFRLGVTYRCIGLLTGVPILCNIVLGLNSWSPKPERNFTFKLEVRLTRLVSSYCVS